MSLLEHKSKENEIQILPPDITFDDVFGHAGNAEIDTPLDNVVDDYNSIDWSRKEFTPIIRRYLSFEGDNREDKMSAISKFLERMRLSGKNGIQLNLSKTDTERHEIAINRLTWLLRYHKTDLIIPAYNWSFNTPLEKLCKNLGDKERFLAFDNFKKWQYQVDLYVYRQKMDKDKQLVHYDRKVVEFDGGYHKKYRQMMKDEWRDHDTKLILPDVTILRYDVDELVPETMRPQDDHASTDFDILRKFITGRNFFSYGDKIDLIGRPITEHLRLNSEDAGRGDYQ